jgi:hypothetical protein
VCTRGSVPAHDGGLIGRIPGVPAGGALGGCSVRSVLHVLDSLFRSGKTVCMSLKRFSKSKQRIEAPLGRHM